MSSRGRFAVVSGFTAFMLMAAAPLTASGSAEADDRQVRKTTITLNVNGCSGCKVQPVQTDGGVVTYWGIERKVRDRKVTWNVPTGRTERMSFLVYAPFDSIAEQGYPMVVVTQFKQKAPGARVSPTFASGTHRASGCWSGTGKSSVRNTLIVKHRHRQGETTAAGWLSRTWESRRYFNRLRAATYHVEDPSICS